MNLRIIFRWYDLWVGVFIDRPNRTLYVFPVPCIGLRIRLSGESGKLSLLDSMDAMFGIVVILLVSAIVVVIAIALAVS